MYGGVKDSLGFTVSSGEAGLVTIFSFSENEIPAGNNKLVVIELESIVDHYGLCLRDVLVSTNHGSKLKGVKVICGSDDFTPDVILTRTPVDNEGGFVVYIQAFVVIDYIEFSIYDKKGNAVEITGYGGHSTSTTFGKEFCFAIIPSLSPLSPVFEEGDKEDLE